VNIMRKTRSSDWYETIQEPGKFAGKPVAVRKLYQCWLDGEKTDGFYDNEGTEIAMFFLDKNEAPLRYAGYDKQIIVSLWEDDAGFVHHAFEE